VLDASNCIAEGQDAEDSRDDPTQWPLTWTCCYDLLVVKNLRVSRLCNGWTLAIARLIGKLCSCCNAWTFALIPLYCTFQPDNCGTSKLFWLLPIKMSLLGNSELIFNFYGSEKKGSRELIGEKAYLLIVGSRIFNCKTLHWSLLAVTRWSQQLSKPLSR